MRRTASLAVFTLLLTSVAGAASAQGVLSSDQVAFRAKADEACTTGYLRLANSAKNYEKHVSVSATGSGSKTKRVAKPTEVAEFLKTDAIVEMKAQLAALKALKVPTADKAGMDQVIKLTTAGIALMEKNPAEIAYFDPFAPVYKQFKAMGGFKQCGQKFKRPDSTLTPAK